MAQEHGSPNCLLALALTLAGYMLADAVHHTRPHDYLRGWARIIVLGTNFVGLALLGLQDDAYLWWYSLGLGFGSGAIYLAMGTPFALWKFSYALSASSIILCLARSCPASVPRCSWACTVSSM